MPVASMEALTKKLMKMGYTQCVAEKSNGQWTVAAFDPLKAVAVKFDNLGSSVVSASAALAKVPSVPAHYVGAYSQTCPKCGVIDKPVIYNEPMSGDTIFCCHSCMHEWIGSTAAMNMSDAEARMRDASEVLHPVLRRIIK